MYMIYTSNIPQEGFVVSENPTVYYIGRMDDQHWSNNTDEPFTMTILEEKIKDVSLNMPNHNINNICNLLRELYNIKYNCLYIYTASILPSGDGVDLYWQDDDLELLITEKDGAFSFYGENSMGTTIKGTCKPDMQTILAWMESSHGNF